VKIGDRVRSSGVWADDDLLWNAPCQNRQPQDGMRCQRRTMEAKWIGKLEGRMSFMKSSLPKLEIQVSTPEGPQKRLEERTYWKCVMTSVFGHSFPRLRRCMIVAASRPAPSVVMVPLPNLPRAEENVL
jgi:hypothetical protein